MCIFLIPRKSFASPDELAAVLGELDFKKFYADYLWLGGGVDPEVRGIDRSGMFTVRQMYRNISELISRKVNVSGRPVLFRDLPFNLKVTSTMANSDLPPDLKDKFNVDDDGLVDLARARRLVVRLRADVHLELLARVDPWRDLHLSRLFRIFHPYVWSVFKSGL